MDKKSIKSVHRNNNETKGTLLDVPIEVDWILGIAHLTQCAEHLNFSSVELKDKNLLEIANLIDKIRIKHLKRLVGNLGGQLYCNTKHKLAALIRLMETGDKLRREGKFEEAMEYYKDSNDILHSVLILSKLPVSRREESRE